MDLLWRKSSYSEGGTSGQCIELAALDHEIGIRDSNTPEAGHLRVGQAELAVMLAAIKANKIDL
ncbi:DUF397 domain-containing protein [Spirillospora sp. NPDC048911]|uniref:DUF397 domain-containing protein n=1 Tax=Spirillospora sp. NPDC048911 TaxID=3364527 RepID=UPI003721F582